MKPTPIGKKMKYPWPDLTTKGWFFWPEYSGHVVSRLHTLATGRKIKISARKAEQEGVVGTLVELKQ